jgi:hypothetical protein
MTRSKFTRHWRAAGCGALLALTGCGGLDTYSYAVRTPFVNGQCLGAIETRQGLGKNGDGKLERLSMDLASSQPQISPATPYGLDWRREAFVPQSSSETCWAAALAMAFKIQGEPRSEASFVTPMRAICPAAVLPKTATVNQIVYALTIATTGEGTWVADRNGEIAAWSREQDERTVAKKVLGLANLGLPPRPLLDIRTGQLRMPGPPPPTLFTPVPWVVTQPNGGSHDGGVFPVMNTHDLVSWASRKVPVVLGYVQGGRAHVVLVVGVTARLGGTLTSGNDLYPFGGGSTKIESVTVIDPAGDGEPISLDGDAMIRSIRFAFAVQV